MTTNGLDRYVVLSQGVPVYTSPSRGDVLVYLWQQRPAVVPDAAFDYVILDAQGAPPQHVMDFTSLNAWLLHSIADAGLPQEALDREDDAW